MDNFAPRSFASPQVKDACISLFKHTPDEMILKINAYIKAGLPGVLNLLGLKWPTNIKSEIRQLVLQGLHK
jgi:hypothetical protein